MLKITTITGQPWLPPERRRVEILAQIRPLRVTEIEQDEDEPRKAMLHWRDPVRRLRLLRRSHTLVDDNPASG